MIVRAIWEFDVDDSEMSEEWVDVQGLCKELTQREVDYLLKHNELNAEDFQYECHPELHSDWDEEDAKQTIDYGYRHNEWLAVYVDDCGKVQIMPFDTLEEANKYLQCCDCKIGVMTTAFYYHRVKESD